MRPDVEITVVIPMKPLASAKARLASVLDAAQRCDLALSLLQRTIETAKATPAVQDTWVVGSDTTVKSAAESLGACWLPDEGLDLNPALTRVMQQCFAAGAQGVLYLPADLPFLQGRDIQDAVWASAGLQNLVLSPALRDGGTNALLIPRAKPFQPMFGERSFSRHLAQAEALGYPVAIYASPGLAFDLDTPDDLAYWRSHSPLSTAQPASRGPGNHGERAQRTST